MKTAYVSVLALLGAAFALSACDQKPQPSKSAASSSAPQPAKSAATVTYDALDRGTFNRVAMEMDLPVYWVADANGNKRLDPDEVASLLFYRTEGQWVAGGKFTDEFEKAYAKMRAWAKSPAMPADLTDAEKKRRALVIEDLAQGRPTLVLSDLRGLAVPEKAFLGHMLKAALLIDDLYGKQNGIHEIAAGIPKDDPSSHALFRRNWGAKCVAPKTEKNPDCKAVPNAPSKIPVGVYPRSVQQKEAFCDTLAKHPNGKQLLAPFVVVAEKDGKLAPVPLTEAYKPEMTAVAQELEAAAKALEDPKETALQQYLQAAATAFRNNNWEPADEAWAKMNATNSRWYVRVGPDEVYWEPCNRKAGFHMSFARINEESLSWQKKLEPVQQELEDALAKHIGSPYKARKVTFHLPDFIDIVLNAGDARHPLGATIGQSLPNWGPVANEGRGRTVVMSNLYTDPDSVEARKEQAASMLTEPTMTQYTQKQGPDLLSTILHEAMHNLGPSHEYKVKGKTDDELFGGPLASTMEELKAQTGALWYVEMLRAKKIIDNEFAKQTYVASIVWALNHIARGMYTDTGKPKPYSQLAAIQMGFLMDEGAITFGADQVAANGRDKAAFTLHFDKLPAAIDKMMALVGGLKAKGDKAKAAELVKKYVDGKVVPMKLIEERSLRHPKAMFLYAVRMSGGGWPHTRGCRGLAACQPTCYFVQLS
ncbi:MAG: hypothetical protein MUF54_06665 [Polyangiaceae bacterium]|nr:hypothetical protein [Polyangiaceae bacterium]